MKTLQQFTELLKDPYKNVKAIIKTYRAVSENEKHKYLNALKDQITVFSVDEKKSRITDDIVQISSENFKCILEIFKTLEHSEYDKSLPTLKDHNRLLILQAMNRYAVTCCVMPTVSQLSRETGITRPTIYSHLEEISEETLTENKQKFQILIDRARMALYQIGMKGETKALTAFLKYTIPALNSPKNNYIQINNTKIDIQQINALPIEKKKDLERVISNYLNDEFGKNEYKVTYADN